SLALHYHKNVPERMRTATYVETGGTYQAVENDKPVWYDPAFISADPRALLFIDLPPGTKFIPAAAEVASDDVYPLFDKIAEQFTSQSRTKAPRYPGGAPEYADDRRKYWEWFSEHFNETTAMVAVEKAAKGKPLNWIAYRVALPGVGEPFLHLWVAG